MNPDLVLLIAMGVMYAGAVYLLLEKTLTRILLGILLMTNATNLLLIITAGEPGLAPLRIEGTDPEAYSDPLPQALTLTAIVIGFAMTAFMLGMIYRSWKLGQDDELRVDQEDVRVAEQPAFDAEDDAEIEEETSEFIDDDRDPNEDYEHTSAAKPSVAHVKDPATGEPVAHGQRRRRRPAPETPKDGETR